VSPDAADPSWTLRRYAYGNTTAAHALVLIATDRDASESHLSPFGTLRANNPITETEVLSEIPRRGVSSRSSKKRGDLSHQSRSPAVLNGPCVDCPVAMEIKRHASQGAPDLHRLKFGNSNVELDAHA
jgi:hypothetical protein